MTPQSTILSASQVKNNFGSIVSKVSTGMYREVIVENHGQPLVAIIDVKELSLMKKLRETEKRKEALARLRALRGQIQARIKGKLSAKEVDAIANRFSRELVEDLEKEGKIRFEQKSA